jgi:hypothetical protein
MSEQLALGTRLPLKSGMRGQGDSVATMPSVHVTDSEQLRVLSHGEHAETSAVLLCVHHLLPLVRCEAAAAARVAQPTLAVCLGILMGGFFAADSQWPKSWDDRPAIALASWALALLATFAVSCWFSGLSPEAQRQPFTRRRRRGTRNGHGLRGETGEELGPRGAAVDPRRVACGQLHSLPSCARRRPRRGRGPRRSPITRTRVFACLR